MKNESNTGNLPRDIRKKARVEPQCILYGLPCADCRAYYPANLKACPVCSSVERVSPQT